MAIDFENESLITLGEACRAFPPSGVSDATLARWVQKGTRGFKLETIVIGGRRLTSREAIGRFIQSQNPAETPSPAVSPSQRKRQSEAARVALQEAGI